MPGRTRKKTKWAIVDLYEVFCAVLYLLRSGCKWGRPDQDAIGVSERSLAWLNKRRHLCKNSTQKLDTSLQFVHMAFLVLLIR